jgi:L-threonylcarbamoyladenylate synthase
MAMYQTLVGKDVDKAAAYLQQEELVAIPTETVYGLAANACSDTAVKKVYAVKQRPSHNPLIVHIDSFDKLHRYTTAIPAAAKLLMEAFAPGPITFILPANGRLSAFVNSRHRQVAFRVPAHPLTEQLLKALPFPLVAPSANLFTTISPTHPSHVMKNFNGAIPYILDGGSCSVGIESTVVGFDEKGQPVVYRQGAITAMEIGAVSGKPVRLNHRDKTLSPGLSSHHYAPRTPLFLLKEKEAIPEDWGSNRVGILCFSQYRKEFPKQNQFVLSPSQHMALAAQNLYKGLHYLDEMKLDVLFAELCPADGLGSTINDRLQRAAQRTVLSPAVLY